MRTPIYLRLTLTILTVLLFGMGMAAVFTWLAVEGLFLSTQRENLLAQAELTASTLNTFPLPGTPDESYSQAANVQPGIHTRLLGEQGAVIVSLPLSPDGAPVEAPLAENAASIPSADLLQRPEIQSALGGNSATAVRKVESAGQRRVLYAAAPVFAGQGEIIGIAYLATPLPPSRLPANIIWQLGGAVVLAAVLAGIAGALLSKRIAAPLEGLAGAASAVAAGDLSRQVPADSNILELHSLGEAFNEMTANLHRSDQAQKTFIANVTHELRTPLTVINGTIETLEDGAVDDLEGRGPLLASMQRETRRLIRLVNDLLVLTRADAGGLNLKMDRIDLAELARQRCQSLTTLAAPAQVALQVQAQDKAIVRGDVDRLSQVLDNLLDNAIRHAPAGSIVTVSVDKQADEIMCAVSDQGPGIAPEHLPFIFGRFYRAERSRARYSGGSGLGLAIVRSLVAAHDGRVAINSLEGRGTTVTIWLKAD